MVCSRGVPRSSVQALSFTAPCLGRSARQGPRSTSFCASGILLQSCSARPNGRPMPANAHIPRLAPPCSASRVAGRPPLSRTLPSPRRYPLRWPPSSICRILVQATKGRQESRCSTYHRETPGVRRGESLTDFSALAWMGWVGHGYPFLAKHPGAGREIEGPV